MEKFTSIRGIAAPMPMANVDTDMIIPKQFLKSASRAGYGKSLFFELRYDAKGIEREDFVLNSPRFRSAQILLAGENFGCGSSREQAVWSLADFGIRCIIAPSFSTIFENNCTNNGILTVRMPSQDVQLLMQKVYHSSGQEMQVDLLAGEVTLGEELRLNFAIEPYRAHRLLNGLDAIGVTLQHRSEIVDFELKHWNENPWLAPEIERDPQ